MSEEKTDRPKSGQSYAEELRQEVKLAYEKIREIYARMKEEEKLKQLGPNPTHEKPHEE